MWRREGHMEGTLRVKSRQVLCCPGRRLSQIFWSFISKVRVCTPPYDMIWTIDKKMRWTNCMFFMWYSKLIHINEYTLKCSRKLSIRQINWNRDYLYFENQLYNPWQKSLSPKYYNYIIYFYNNLNVHHYLFIIILRSTVPFYVHLYLKSDINNKRARGREHYYA